MNTLYIDITNTAHTGAKTGIQRVVRELSRRLDTEPLHIVFLRFHRPDRIYYRFSSFGDGMAQPFPPPQGSGAALEFSQFTAGDMFFDLDAAWGDPLDRYSLLPKLKRQGVIIICMHYDAVPVLFPNFSHPNTVFRYTGHFAAHLDYADYFICISDTVKKDLERLSLQITGRRVNAFTLPLGADFQNGNLKDMEVRTEPEPGVAPLLTRRFLLVVGTLEPRKNHALVLEAFDRLDPALGLSLVLVGKKGWNIEDLADTIRNRKDFNHKVFWLENADDPALALLYQKAFACLNLAHYEGYGLPVIESMNHDCVTVCSKGGALEEVAAGCGLILEENTASCLARVITGLVENQDLYLEYKARAQGFVCPTWDAACTRLIQIMDRIREADDFNWGFIPRQAVYISIDPGHMALSLESVVQHLPFIQKFILLTAEVHRDDMARVLDQTGKTYVIITDEEIWNQAGVTPDRFRDHQRRNTFLRKALYSHKEVDPNVISFDDDYLVQQQIGPEFFLDGTRHNAFACMDDMDHWLGTPNRPTSYDSGIFSTARVLSACGYPKRLFSSHMPQIVNKKMADLVYGRMVGPDSVAMDEWSIYFNLLSHLFPQRCRVKHYQTLSWPCRPTDWLPDALPDAPVFENYYDCNYQKGGLFYGKDVLGAFAEKTLVWQNEFAGHYRQREMNRQRFGTDHPVATLTDTGIETDLEAWATTENQLDRIILDNQIRTLTRAELTARIKYNGKTIHQDQVDPATSRWLPVEVYRKPCALELEFRDLEKNEIIDTQQVKFVFTDPSDPGALDTGTPKETAQMTRHQLISRLMAVEDNENFVIEAWDLILGRRPDPGELAFALAQLNAGIPKQEFITRILLSPEAGNKRIRLSAPERLRVRLTHTFATLCSRIRVLSRFSRAGFLENRSFDRLIFDLQQQVSDQARELAEIRDRQIADIREQLRTGMEARLKDMETQVVYLQNQAALAQQRRLDQFCFDVRQELGRADVPENALEKMENFSGHALDEFYTALEQVYRGSRESIKQRYLPYLERLGPLLEGTQPCRAADLGCGRGEWLEILTRAVDRVQGVDAHPAMVAQCREHGLEAERQDLVEWLETQPDNTLDLITAFHVIEHLEFDPLSRMIAQMFRVLAPGGIIMLETPNPENLHVAAHMFYRDPTHKAPVPKELAGLLLTHQGFVDLEIHPVHPFPKEMHLAEDSEVARRFNQLVYGAQDYLITAKKPMEDK